MPGYITKSMLPVFKIIIIFFILNMATYKSVAQQPGGVDVPGAKVWLIPFRQGNQYKWISKNENKGIDFRNPIAIKDTQNINYYTSLKFPSTPNIINISNLKVASIITAFYPNPQSGSTPIPDGFYRIDYNGMLLSKFNYNKAIVTTNEKDIIINNKYPIASSPANTAMKITAHYFSGFPALDGSSPGAIAKETKLAMTFNGYCPEMLIYETPLSPMDVWKLQTYFAIKYGITLDTSYISTDGKTILWDRDAMMKIGFHNRVCAIGRDINGAIDQFISNTSYEEGKFDAYTNPSNGKNRSVSIGFDGTDYPDKSFLFWGDDNGSIQKPDFIARNITGADSSKKIELVKRKWIIQNGKDIKQTTRVELGASLLDNLKNDDYNYLVVKLDKSLDSSDIYPLDSSMSNGKWYRSGMNWKIGVDTFTFGRVEKMYFYYNEMSVRFEECGGLEKIKKIPPPNALSYEKRNGIYYYYNKPRILDPLCRRLVYWYYISSQKKVVFYMNGGIGPYGLLVDSKQYSDFIYNEDKKTFEVDGLSPGAAHKLVVTDMTTQKSIEVTVKVP